MSQNCTRCEGTGFLNLDQAPQDIVAEGHDAVLSWLDELAAKASRLGGCSCPSGHPPCSYCVDTQTDVQVCDCCGDGISQWHGEPGRHYSVNDPLGKDGPYSYNGGLCECH
ncbi:hypothetical protein NA78x_001765 [Anatilimnocola sp. NA78]|uniref:hypothetical protein n=1 Tax=Anatilimnocola sp. NA78 TaxID=3415683 RepID=UPI003CE514CD